MHSSSVVSTCSNTHSLIADDVVRLIPLHNIIYNNMQELAPPYNHLMQVVTAWVATVTNSFSRKLSSLVVTIRSLRFCLAYHVLNY